ncbi:hypothetical protein MCOR28_000601 [Pyricularia oryzae]|uniref:Rhodopsin domain-containing protein n=1 Tax=Pyricularia grisea TaxID=148305 RepID=A0ABQ8NWN1_PYRGI|nr:hypothetical protein MCOR33_001845 [Pyricularia grisea]KAI6342517.1 hypothetical protein MCOR30_001761 [Pyricularia oryzae]KAI6349820.1 hypothetical protein MCOR28_000601 [Pyricularia oryzae]KAI6596441.1 hypothetical protein MCOR12_006112 [Pyricularia oryzae]
MLIPRHATRDSLPLTHPDTSRPWYYLCCILPALAIPVLLLRLWTVSFIFRRWRASDSNTGDNKLFGVIFAVTEAYFIFGVTEVMSGATSLVNCLYLSKLNGLVSMPAYCIATGLAKASVILYLLNFTTTASPRAIRIIAYATLVLSIIQCLILAGGTMACAASLRGLLDLFGTGISDLPTCTRLGEIWVSTAMINSFTDLVILLLPVWILRPLQVGRAKKIGVLAILMAGGFVFGVSVYRAYKSFEAFTMLSKDVSLWSFSDTAMWCVVELWAGIVCACLPALRPFCRHMCGLVHERTTRTGGTTSDASGRRSGLHFHKYTRQTEMELSATTNNAPHRPPSRESSRPIQGVVRPPSPSLSGGSRIRSQDMEQRSIDEHV